MESGRMGMSFDKTPKAAGPSVCERRPATSSQESEEHRVRT